MSGTPKHPTPPARQRLDDPVDTPLLVAVPDAARLLGIGTTFAWELVRAGDIPSVKLGRRVLVPRSALERLAGAPAPAPAQEAAEDSSTPRPLIPAFYRDLGHERNTHGTGQYS